MWKASNDSMRVLASPKHSVLGLNITVQKQVGLIRKPDIIQEFLVIVDLCRGHLATIIFASTPQLVFGLNSIGINFESVNQNVLGWCDKVLWHINHCRLFNAKSSLYIYIKYIWFGWVGFYGISTIVGYLMPNPLYTYILDIYDLVGLGFMAYQPL